MVTQIIESIQIYKELQSSRFCKLLAEAGDYTFSTGYESGFGLAVDKKMKVHFSEVERGGPESVHGEYFPYDHGLELKGFFFGHFHPEDEGPIIPSEEDFYAISPEYRSDSLSSRNGRELLGIGQISGNKDISLLLVQNKTTNAILFQELLNELDEEEYGNTEKVVDVLRNSLIYNSDILRYKFIRRDLYTPQLTEARLSNFLPIELSGSNY